MPDAENLAVGPRAGLASYLRACPFCRGDDPIVLHDPAPDFGHRPFVVRCYDCGAKGGGEATREAAVAAWNKVSDAATGTLGSLAKANTELGLAHVDLLAERDRLQEALDELVWLKRLKTLIESGRAPEGAADTYRSRKDAAWTKARAAHRATFTPSPPRDDLYDGRMPLEDDDA